MSGNPRNGTTPEPFDLEAAAKAAAAEAEAVPFAFRYKGESYTIPPVKQWEMTAMEALASGDLTGALTDLLGQEAYAALRDAGLNLGELEALFERVAGDTTGVSLPNSRPQQRLVSTRT